ncbi:hypothetical protein JFU58_11695 [Pseudomonas sp. TH34]|uniref:hypothetical protein n=1 Tax=Pseudomonas TaxID=286 RepID=UPI000B82C450|nr:MULTISPECIES: hypothetical protein [Pseudomonas]MBK5409199.1 hypothetical protein [Pseudomonas sp. TH34]MBV6661860.1 hypothetical protein [Pseudomonas yamanorum]
MPDYTPLDSNISCDPVLFLNPDADARGLLETATQRIEAARNLLNSVICLSTERVEGADLQHFASAAQLLLQDGCDALQALGWKEGRVG